jgi:pimeloyl-ACP methyl ester carboxylesterase
MIMRLPVRWLRPTYRTLSAHHSPLGSRGRMLGPRVTFPWLLILIAAVAVSVDPCIVAAQQSSPRMIDVEGRQVRVMTGGLEHLERGQHVVVLESGAGTPIENWRAIFADIAAFAPVIAYDRSGIGRSPWDGEPPTPQRRVQQLRALLAVLEVPPPYVLVGHSWGGPLIRSFAGHHPGDVAGLVYLDPTDFTETRADLMTLFESLWPGRGQAALEAVEELQRSASAEAPPAVRAEMETNSAFMAAELEQRDLGEAPSVPTAVILGANFSPPPLPAGIELPFDLRTFFEAGQRQRVARMSTWTLDAPDGLFAAAKYGRHFVHQDDPDLAVHAIRRVLSPDIGAQLRAALAANGSGALTDTYRALKRRYPADQLTENLLNRLGYELLREEQVHHAIAVFELNVAEYPDAWNPHDSLGDAFAAAGERAKAMASYRRSLELNPDSPSRAKLEALERGQ